MDKEAGAEAEQISGHNWASTDRIPHHSEPHLEDTREQTCPSSSPSQASQVPGSSPPHTVADILSSLYRACIATSLTPSTKSQDFFKSRYIYLCEASPLPSSPLSPAQLLCSFESIVSTLLSTLSVLYFNSALAAFPSQFSTRCLQRVSNLTLLTVASAQNKAQQSDEISSGNKNSLLVPMETTAMPSETKRSAF